MMSRSVLLSFAGNPLVRGYFTKRGMASGLVRRFVAGETLQDALLVTKELKDKGILSVMDVLGENVLNQQEAERATEMYLVVIKALATFYQNASLSVKLTALGLDIQEAIAIMNLRRLLDEAKERGSVFICVDMEGSAYTERTIEIVTAEHEKYQNIGTVVQSYLRRSDADLAALISNEVPVRLVKGAYAEPPHIAYQRKKDVDAAFRRQMWTLLDSGTRPAIATHDEHMINAAKVYARQKNIPSEKFEFQMLLGIRRDLQEGLVKEGCVVRVYVPFGQSWYPYFTRRLAERPANLRFFLRNLFRK
jgi:proline dehydrogenase